MSTQLQNCQHTTRMTGLIVDDNFYDKKTQQKFGENSCRH